MSLSSKSLASGQLKTEAIAGVTTFFTMAYIVIVNPSILSTPGTGMSFSGVLTATVLLSMLMTLMMGVYAKLPFAVAPGMGINAFFAFTLVLGQKIPWPTALGIVFWAGVLFLVISVLPIRESIARSIPKNIRVAAAVGIGIFLTFIGLKNLGLIVADPATFVRFGGMTKESALGILGGAIMAFLLQKKNPFAFLAGMAFVTTVAILMGWVKPPEKILSAPDFKSVFLKLDFWGAFRPEYLGAIVAIFFTDLFDSISTFVGVSQATKMTNRNGEPINLKQGLIVDSFATIGAGLAGTSSGTAFIESAAGIEVGGRTGWTSVFTALCFIPCFFISPLAGMVPGYASGPVLLLVGALMFRTVKELDFKSLEDTVPQFLTAALIPLTFSITTGLLCGFVSHVALYTMFGRAKEIKPWLWVIAATSACLLWLSR